MRIHYKFLLAILSCCALLVLALPAPSSRSDAGVRVNTVDPGFWKRLVQDNVPINFQGIVRDREGNAIEGATVTLSVHKYVLEGPSHELVQDFVMLTGADGTFKLEGAEGDRLYLRSITKDGYSFRKEQGVPTTFDYVKKGAYYDSNTFIKSWPMQFQMRKLAPDSILLAQDYQIILEPSKESYAVIDLVEDVIRKEGRNGDLVLKAGKSAKTGTPVIQISALGPNAGIIQTPREVYAAPRRGYERELPIEYRGQDSNKKWHFVVTSRSAPIFSRLELSVVDHLDRVWVTVYSVTNPFGGTELESKPDVPYEQLKRVRENLRNRVRKNEPLGPQ